MDEGVKVFGAWASPMSRRVELALKLKGVEYSFIDEDLSNKSPLLLKYNPVYKKIPVLLHNGKPIAESLVILEYIEETWRNNPILPQDPYERAMARFWAKFIDEKCLLQVWKACWSLEKEAIQEASENMKILETALEGKKFFGGESIGLVDIGAMFFAYWVEVIQEVCGLQLIDGEKFPTLKQWAEELIATAAVRENLPHRDKLLELYKDHKETILASIKNP